MSESLRRYQTSLIAVTRRIRTATVLAAILAVAARRLSGQTVRADSVPKGEALQVIDTAFIAKLPHAAVFKRGTGPLVLIDEAHHNFHTASGRYRPFAQLVEADGFRVAPNQKRFDAASLAGARVLVVANALDPRNERQTDWRLPALSAFDSSEIAAVAEWVRRGGSLLIIADHMPFPGAVTKLAAAFGVHYANGFALWGEVDPRTGDYPIVFRRADGTLQANPVSNGRSKAERVDSIVSFTGSALRIANPTGLDVMRLPVSTRLMLPVVAWQFSDSTATMAGDGMLQGGVARFGRGRVAAFGEAAMFTAQRKGAARVPMGMNAPEANQNPQFILNLMHWLVHLTN